jgi:hypothetical protein
MDNNSLDHSNYLDQWPNLPPTTKPSTFITLLFYKASDTRSAKQPFLLFFGKGKAIPLQTWTGPEGSRRLRFPDFKTQII